MYVYVKNLCSVIENGYKRFCLFWVLVIECNLIWISKFHIYFFFLNFFIWIIFHGPIGVELGYQFSCCDLAFKSGHFAAKGLIWA